MKKWILTVALMLLSVGGFAQEKAYKAFVKHLSKSAATATVKLGEREVLLVSQEVFGNNMDSNLEAVEASIFALDKEGKILCLGSIRSQGTLYPVTVLDDKLMVAGHRFVKIYSLRGEVPELELSDYEEEENEKLASLFATFEKGTPILFSRKR